MGCAGAGLGEGAGLVRGRCWAKDRCWARGRCWVRCWVRCWARCRFWVRGRCWVRCRCWARLLVDGIALNLHSNPTGGTNIPILQMEKQVAREGHGTCWSPQSVEDAKQ